MYLHSTFSGWSIARGYSVAAYWLRCVSGTELGVLHSMCHGLT